MIQELLIKRFAEESLNWIGVRYRHRGMTKNGCDCTGMIIGILRRLGYMANYVLRIYSMQWNLHAGAGNYIEEELLKISNEIPKREASAGDILLLRFGNCLAHTGILLDPVNGKFIHCLFTANKASKVKYGILRNSLWSSRWEKTFRLDVDKLGRISQ